MLGTRESPPYYEVQSKNLVAICFLECSHKAILISQQQQIREGTTKGSTTAVSLKQKKSEDQQKYGEPPTYQVHSEVHVQHLSLIHI